ncbi:conjugal transfer protein TraQ [Pseudomonas asuensis]|uniref:Conjugal transfer protein TraQ n=1 Tax=Pseudomonas asuensis TaxID=1825787 RepID=A0ABQ2H2W4_9PSED|nr:conjugal transfer protein TraQ [Pseudomonas asuensis]GGM26093.1 hypothetical protein GCM10009425_41030 [Pseudomonas asuensis]
MDLAQMITAFAPTFATALWGLLWALGGLLGTVYVGNSLLKMQRSQRFPGQIPVTFGDVLPVILVGGLVANLSRFINATWNTFATGTVSYGAVSYSGAADFGRFAEAINAVLTLASVAGGVFALRGLVILKKSLMDGQQSQGADDGVWRALTHIVGGAMLVQIAEMIEKFRESFHLYW